MKLRRLRVITQTLSFLAVNLGISSALKTGFVCPFLYCYGCPLATFGCPIGVLQNYLLLGRPPLYPGGVLGIYGISLGRFFCGWCCPFGTFQELLGRLRGRRLKPTPRWYIKYAVLAGVLALAWITADTFFCKLCPSGSLFAALPYRILHPNLPFGLFFYVHLLTLTILIPLFLLAGRFWCSYLCPLAPIMGSFNSVSFLRIRLDPDKCIECGACLRDCPMNIQKLEDISFSSDCILCGRCVDSCPENALQMKMRS